MPDQRIELMQTVVDAVERGDLAAAQAAFHPQAEFRNATAKVESVTFSGETLITDWASAVSEVWEDYRFEVEQFDEEGDGMIARIRNRGRARGSGMPLDDPRYIGLRFKEGKIWRGETFRTEEEARRYARG
jgi:ketosteroid isomerase-like protein